jgi:hypothetical protein
MLQSPIFDDQSSLGIGLAAASEPIFFCIQGVWLSCMPVGTPELVKIIERSAASQDTFLSSFRPSGIFRRPPSIVATVKPIPTPFPDIAEHIHDTIGAGSLRIIPHLCCQTIIEQWPPRYSWCIKVLFAFKVL